MIVTILADEYNKVIGIAYEYSTCTIIADK